MSNPEPTIRIGVALTNPGQFFACCGLLELADRLDANAQGWFAGDEFLLATERSLRELLDAMLGREAEAQAMLESGLPVKPIIAPLRLRLDQSGKATLILDAWMRVGLDKGWPVAMGNSPWNFWSGQQTSSGIWSVLRTELAEQIASLGQQDMRDLFTQRILLSGRFGFDPGAAWDALDAGFSPNAQGLAVASSPAVEMLAAVGLQRFRPVMSRDRRSFDYASWPIPLAAPVAACAAAAARITPGLSLFRGRVVSRGQYAALGHSIELT